MDDMNLQARRVNGLCFQVKVAQSHERREFREVGQAAGTDLGRIRHLEREGHQGQLHGLIASHTPIDGAQQVCTPMPKLHLLEAAFSHGA